MMELEDDTRGTSLTFVVKRTRVTLNKNLRAKREEMRVWKGMVVEIRAAMVGTQSKCYKQWQNGKAWSKEFLVILCF
jgi:hypothetical protein